MGAVTFGAPVAVSDLMAPAALEGQRHPDLGPWALACYETRRRLDLGDAATVPPVSRGAIGRHGTFQSFSKTSIDFDRSEVR